MVGGQTFGIETRSLGTETRNLEIQDGEDVDVLRRPGPDMMNRKVLFFRDEPFGVRTRPCLTSKPGLRRTSTSSPSWISKFLVSVPRLLVSTPKVCSPTKNVMDKNKDVADDSKDGNGGFQDPGRRGRRRPEEP